MGNCPCEFSLKSEIRMVMRAIKDGASAKSIAHGVAKDVMSAVKHKDSQTVYKTTYNVGTDRHGKKVLVADGYDSTKPVRPTSLAANYYYDKKTEEDKQVAKTQLRMNWHQERAALSLSEGQEFFSLALADGASTVDDGVSLQKWTKVGNQVVQETVLLSGASTENIKGLFGELAQGREVRGLKSKDNSLLFTGIFGDQQNTLGLKKDLPRLLEKIKGNSARLEPSPIKPISIDRKRDLLPQFPIRENPNLLLPANTYLGQGSNAFRLDISRPPILGIKPFGLPIVNILIASGVVMGEFEKSKDKQQAPNSSKEKAREGFSRASTEADSKQNRKSAASEEKTESTGESKSETVVAGYLASQKRVDNLAISSETVKKDKLDTTASVVNLSNQKAETAKIISPIEGKTRVPKTVLQVTDSPALVTATVFQEKVKQIEPNKPEVEEAPRQTDIITGKSIGRVNLEESARLETEKTESSEELIPTKMDQPKQTPQLEKPEQPEQSEISVVLSSGSISISDILNRYVTEVTPVKLTALPEKDKDGVINQKETREVEEINFDNPFLFELEPLNEGISSKTNQLVNSGQSFPCLSTSLKSLRRRLKRRKRDWRIKVEETLANVYLMDSRVSQQPTFIY